MLLGTFPMTVDAKARVTLPASFRKQMDKKIVLVPYGDCVNGFTPEGFNSWIESLFERDGQGFNPRNQADKRLRVGITANSVEVDIDSAGRVALGKIDNARSGRRQKLGLEGDVVVIGAYDHFEVWNAEKWNKAQEAFDDDFESLLYEK